MSQSILSNLSSLRATTCSYPIYTTVLRRYCPIGAAGSPSTRRRRSSLNSPSLFLPQLAVVVPLSLLLLAAAGAEIIVGTWVPALNIFETSLRRRKFDESRVLPDGSLMEIAKVYPLDAVFDSSEDVPEDIKTNKRYAGSSNWTVKVTKPLLETSRYEYLAAISASSYFYVSLLKHFLPIMNPGGSSLSLTYIASERIIPRYGGGMSSEKAALESETYVMAFEVGRKHRIRVNTISAGTQ